jgi:hypothetical protein
METLTLEQASYIAEIIGVLSIVMSLVYVAVQIRQNTVAIRSETSQSIHDTWGDVYGRLSTNSGLTQIMLKGNPGLDALSDADKGQYMSFWMHTMLTWQNAYYQYKAGTLEEIIWHTMRKTMLSALLSSPGFKEFWTSRKSLFDDEYKEYLDNELSTGTIAPGYRVFGVQEPITDSTD